MVVFVVYFPEVMVVGTVKSLIAVCMSPSNTSGRDDMIKQTRRTCDEGSDLRSCRLETGVSVGLVGRIVCEVSSIFTRVSQPCSCRRATKYPKERENSCDTLNPLEMLRGHRAVNRSRHRPEVRAGRKR
jgi:hypothetical protein